MPPPEELTLEAVAERLGIPLDPEAASKLRGYLKLLARWNETYNLTAVRDPAQMVAQHLADCMAVIPALRRQRPNGEGRMLDVGSGGGLPGVVIAILSTGWKVTCVDAVGKKAAFVRQVAAELQLPNLHAEHGRVERCTGSYEIVASRAFATLPEFCRLTRDRLSDEGAWLAMKGLVPHDELNALPSDIEAFHVEQLDVPGLQARRCLVWMRPVRR